MNNNNLKFTTKELTLISVFSSVWIVSQIYLGPWIGQITQQHSIINRIVGWLLMLVLAELTGRFGRVTAMSFIAAFATRIVRRSASLYALTVGLGYALAGFIFDMLFFLPYTESLGGKTRKAYLLAASIISGIIALVPYLIFKFSMLSPYGFLALLPKYAYSLGKGTLLSFLGTFIGLSLMPKIEIWKAKIRT